jgi:hypothetical protein
MSSNATVDMKTVPAASDEQYLPLCGRGGFPKKA